MTKILIFWLLTTIIIAWIFFLRKEINLKYLFIAIAFLAIGAMILAAFVLLF